MAKILAIDDDPISLRVASATLSKAGHEVVSLPLGTEALNYLRSGEMVDLVVSDIMMPGLDGFDLVKAIKKNNSTKNLPIILCSSLKDQASVVQGIKLGVSGYVTKPFQPDLLIAKVDDVLSTSQLTIVVVDSEKILRDLLVRILVGGGYKANAVASVAEALELANNNNVSMIIIDMALPDFNSDEFITSLENDKPNMKVILMADRCNEISDEKASSMGASGIITKPFQNTKILTDIRALSS